MRTECEALNRTLVTEHGIRPAACGATAFAAVKYRIRNSSGLGPLRLHALCEACVDRYLRHPMTEVEDLEELG